MATAKYYGQYKIIAELGRGGMAVVYKCWEESLHRFVAIKVLSEHLINNNELKERFLREAKSMAAINHPNVIQVHFIGEQEGLPYFAMEFIDGKSLSDILIADSNLLLNHAKNLLFQACQGLLAAHKIGLIHRDIKPGNLMISDEGQLKLVDFGIAHSHDFEKRLTSTGDLVGTPGYLPPEACVGETLDLRADIYSMGIVFYQMLAGRIPFENTSPLGLLQEVANSHIVDIREINKKVDITTANLLEKMVARDPADRFQGCQVIIDLLERPARNDSINAMIKARGKLTYSQSRSKLGNQNTLVNKQVVSKQSKQTKAKWNKNIVSLILIMLLVTVFYFYFNSPQEQNNQAATNQDFVSNNQDAKTDQLTEFQEGLDKLAETDDPYLPAFGSEANNLNALQCVEVSNFKLANNKALSLDNQKKAKKLLKKLHQLTINYLIKEGNLNAYAAGGKACLNKRQPLLLKADVKQGKLSKFLSGSGIEKGKVYITLTLINTNNKVRLAQKRMTIKNMRQQLEQANPNQNLNFIKNTLVFIHSAIGL